MAAQYLETTGGNEQSASTLYDSGDDGYTEGFFLAARINSLGLDHAGIEQAIISKFYGNSYANITWNWWLNNQVEGVVEFEWREPGDTVCTPNSSGDLIVDKGLSDGKDFWMGLSVTFTGGNGYVQHYYGGEGGAPVWETYGAEIECVGDTDLVVDAGSEIRVGLNRYGVGGDDFFWGKIYEGQYFSQPYSDIHAGNLVAAFTAEDFTVGDGGTDTATGSHDARLWTLTGDSAMIKNDTGVDAGNTQWWPDEPAPVVEVVEESGGASDADIGRKHPRSSGAARRRIVDLDDPRRKYRLPY